MDALVKAALDKVTAEIGSLPWDTINQSKEKGCYQEPIKEPVSASVAKAVHAVDALKSSLKALW